MNRWIVLVIAIVSVSASAAPSDPTTLRVGIGSKVTAGDHRVVLNVYTLREGGAPIATESHSVLIDANGSFTTPLGGLAAVASSSEERWLGVQVLPNAEAARVKLTARPAPPVRLYVVPTAAIWGGGIIESASGGFRFPDGSVQTSAATISGGVPSVNGIGSAVTITGTGLATVGTVGGAITVNASGISGVTAGNGLSGGGSSGTPTLSADFGTSLPASVASSSNAGRATTLARADHVHAHGASGGGSLHTTATTTTAGFMSSSDRSKLDSLVPYVRTILVSPVPGDATGSGTALLNAFNGITDNSSTNPYLVKVEPGVYDLGTAGLTMKEYVDLEGSGQSTTFITTNRGATSCDSTSAVITLSSNSELRNLKISQDSSTYCSCGVFGTYGVTNSRVTGVAVSVSTSATSGYTFGVNVSASVAGDVGAHQLNVTAVGTATTGTTVINGVYVRSVLVSDSSISVSGGSANHAAVLMEGSTLSESTLSASNASMNYAVYCTDGTAVVRSSRITVSGTIGNHHAVEASNLGRLRVLNCIVHADADSAVALLATATYWSFRSRLDVENSEIWAQNGTASYESEGDIYIAGSLVSGAVTGPPVCVGAYTSAFVALNASCQ